MRSHDLGLVVRRRQDLPEELEDGTNARAVTQVFVDRLPDLARLGLAFERHSNQVMVVVGDALGMTPSFTVQVTVRVALAPPFVGSVAVDL